jgi:hypothetical protein
MDRHTATATVAQMTPVAENALAGLSHETVVRDIRRALLRLVGQDVFGACDIAAEAIVTLAGIHAVQVDEPVMPPAAADIRLAHDFPRFGG